MVDYRELRMLLVTLPYQKKKSIGYKNVCNEELYKLYSSSKMGSSNERALHHWANH